MPRKDIIYLTACAVLGLTVILLIGIFIIPGHGAFDGCVKQLLDAENGLNTLKGENADLQSRLDDLQGDIIDIKEAVRSLRVISPNGGETLCVGDKFAIKLDVQNVETISLVLVAYHPSSESYNYVGNFSGLNEAGEYGQWLFDWQVGDFESQFTDLDDDTAYKLKVVSVDGASETEDYSDAVFHIIKCKG